MYAKLFALALLVAAAGAESCGGCVRRAIKDHMSDRATTLSYCERTFLSVGLDMCYWNGRCGAEDKGDENIKRAAKPFCDMVRSKAGGAKKVVLAKYA